MGATGLEHPHPTHGNKWIPKWLEWLIYVGRPKVQVFIINILNLILKIELYRPQKAQVHTPCF